VAYKLAIATTGLTDECLSYAMHGDAQGIPYDIDRARRYAVARQMSVMRAPSRLCSAHAFNFDSFNKYLPCSNRHQFYLGDVGEVPVR
jgi:hypothetical protein